jgi:nicotinamidase-related amidase
MPLSRLDPRPALVVIDLQKGLMRIPAAHPMTEIAQHAATLADAFGRRRFPVVLVTVTGTPPGRTDGPRLGFTPPPGWADPAGELGARPDDYKITKTGWGAFCGTSLHAHLSGEGVTQVVLAGFATSAGVESTARAAHEHGYNVVLVTDAMTDPDRAAHNHSIEKIFPQVGETTTTSEIIGMLGAER